MTPSNTCSNCSALALDPNTLPIPYPVWFENCTLLTQSTSHPTHCSGNVAALLPTYPCTTCDWQAKILGIPSIKSQKNSSQIYDSRTGLTIPAVYYFSLPKIKTHSLWKASPYHLPIGYFFFFYYYFILYICVMYFRYSMFTITC